jgi:hypothetical protein
MVATRLQSKQRKMGLWGLGVIVVIVVVVVVVVLSMKKRSTSPSPAAARRSNSTTAAARRSGAAAGSSCRSGGACGNTEVFYDGQTANSDMQPDATLTQEILQTATQGDMRQGTASAKNLALVQQGLSSGGMYNFSDELINQVVQTGDVNLLVASAAEQDPELTKRILEASAQRADSTGISRSRMTTGDMKNLVAVETGLEVTSLGGRDSSSSSSAGRPQNMAALAHAVGSDNMKYYTESKRQFDNLIDEIFVSTANAAQVAALTAIINNEADPLKKQKLLLGLRGLKTAMFSSGTKAREALANVTDLGFQYQKPARGEVGTLGSRYGAQGTSGGPGGDLMGVFFAEDVIPTVNKERLAVCGGATTQAYEYALGDKSVLDPSMQQ